jgi:DNA-binding CsgD family transcriptional regulator
MKPPQVFDQPDERRDHQPLPAVRMRSRDEWALTDKQRAILVQASHGRTHHEIADAMGITLSTVKNHLTSIRRQTGYDGTITGLVLEAISRGIIPFPGGEVTA